MKNLRIKFEIKINKVLCLIKKKPQGKNVLCVVMDVNDYCDDHSAIYINIEALYT